MTLVIIDYGIGNIESVANSFKKVGGNPMFSEDGISLMRLNPSRIVLPGVGASGEALRILEKRGFIPILNELVLENKILFLGICVGMQMMASSCEEFGFHKGLDWISGTVRKISLPKQSKLKLPHIGWNTIDLKDKNDPILSSVNGNDFYFVHSYVFECSSEYVLARTTYGIPFISAVKKENIYGLQFHPEKSSGIGEVVFREFLNLENNV